MVGASITGPILALLLCRAGFDAVSVLDAAPAVTERGGGVLGLRHPSLDILDRAGVDQNDYVTHPSERIRTIEVRHRRTNGPATHLYPGRNTTWTQLHHALTRRLPDGTLRTGQRVTHLHLAGGRPQLTVAGADPYSADLVIFCDGRTSVGRRILDPRRRLRYAGYVAHRGHTDAPTDNRTSYLADFCRYEPVPGGLQFNLAPVPGGLDWTMHLNTHAADYTAWCGTTPTRRAYLPAAPQAARDQVDQAAAEHLPAELADLVADTPRRAAAPVLDIPAPRRMVWPLGRGHTILLGDALAPVRPHTGMGANLGIEQAAGLTAALTQHSRHGADLPTALESFQARHLPAVTAVLREGRAIARALRLGV
ncbi:monooxygenase [Cryptosporangium phraense]|uniref:Monooxygenase n=1 Tax=Cryptosporangium phraense TaxID=2593070 RepID=A0A545ANP5_9ACTN|nr:monooxygenase [Cryptosporangium phraense]